MTARLFALSSVLAVAVACGADASEPLACEDPSRLPPPDRTVPYGAACCADAECADPPFDDGGAPSTARALCVSVTGATLCTRTCAAAADCSGYGPETCDAGGVCDTAQNE